MHDLRGGLLGVGHGDAVLELVLVKAERDDFDGGVRVRLCVPGLFVEVKEKFGKSKSKQAKQTRPKNREETVAAAQSEGCQGWERPRKKTRFPPTA